MVYKHPMCKSAGRSACAQGAASSLAGPATAGRLCERECLPPSNSPIAVPSVGEANPLAPDAGADDLASVHTAWAVLGCGWEVAAGQQPAMVHAKPRTACRAASMHLRIFKIFPVIRD